MVFHRPVELARHTGSYDWFKALFGGSGRRRTNRLPGRAAVFPLIVGELLYLRVHPQELDQ
jgi:hypothetical protein